MLVSRATSKNAGYLGLVSESDSELKVVTSTTATVPLLYVPAIGEDERQCMKSPAFPNLTKKHKTNQ